MNELRELDVVEMSAIEGGSDILGDLLAALEDILTAEILGPVLESISSFFSDLQSAVVSFLQGLFDF